MSYRIYTTEALVLSSYDNREANCLYTLLTRDLGLIRAQAQGVRLLKSKLRYALEPHSFVDVSLVRGKDIWRVTSASFNKNIYADVKGDTRKASVLVNSSRLIRRLVQGELPEPRLFDVVKEGFRTLSNEELGDKNIADLEVLLVLRILHILGYINGEGNVQEIVGVDHFEESMFEIAQSFRPHILRTINSSLQETNL